jgi:hypothetical protein
MIRESEIIVMSIRVLPHVQEEGGEERGREMKRGRG